MARYNEANVQMPSVGNINPINTQSTKEVDLLAKDIEVLLGGTQKVNQAVYEASEYATKLAAIDTDYNTQKGFEEIYNQTVGVKLGRGETPTSEDYKTMIEWRTKFFQDTLTNVASENDTNNTIYKEMFYKPSKDVLDKANRQDMQTYKTLFTQEKYNESAVRVSTASLTFNTPKTIASEIDNLALVDIDRESATRFVWKNATKNQIEKFEGLSSDLIRQYVASGKENELVDKYFGNFLKYEDGSLPSKENVDDVSAMEMRDALNQRISQAKRELAQINKKEEVKTKTIQTVSQSASSITFDAPTASVNNVYQSSLQQVMQLGNIVETEPDNDVAARNYQTALQNLQKISVTKDQHEHFAIMSNLFLDDPENTLIESRDFNTYIPNIRGMQETAIYSRVKDTEIVSAMSEQYIKGYEQSIRTGDTATAQKNVKALSVLAMRGYESPAINAIERKFANQNNFTQSLRQQNSIKSFMSVIDSASAYRDGTNSDIQFLTPEVIDSINSQYNTLLLEVQNGKTTEKEALTKLKLSAGINIDNTNKASFTTEQSRAMSLKLGLDPNDPDELDTLIKGFYNVGVADFADGALESSFKYLMDNKSQQITTPDAAKRELRNVLTKVDSTGMPWSKGLVVANTTGMDDKTFKNNLKSHILYRVGEMAAAKNIDFDDLSGNIEDNDVTVSQRYQYVPESGTKELLTKITLFSNGVMMGTMVLRPSELRKDFSSQVKAKYPKAFNIKTKKQDYTTDGVLF